MTELLKGFHLKNPFSQPVVRLMEHICFSILMIWTITLVHNAHLKALEKAVGINTTYNDGAYLVWSAMVYVLAQVFKHGIKIQAENDMTI